MRKCITNIDIFGTYAKCIPINGSDRIAVKNLIILTILHDNIKVRPT